MVVREPQFIAVVLNRKGHIVYIYVLCNVLFGVIERGILQVFLLKHDAYRKRKSYYR